MINHYTPLYNSDDCFECTTPIRIAMPGSMNQIPSQGVPAGLNQIMQQSPSGLTPITPTTEPQAMTLESTEYLNGFLRTQIGKRVRVEFLIGTGTLIDKSGTLLSVGANYITLRLFETDDVLVCDFFTIKFITFYL